MAIQALPEMFRSGTASLEYVGKSQGANSDGTGDCITHAIDTACPLNFSSGPDLLMSILMTDCGRYSRYSSVI